MILVVYQEEMGHCSRLIVWLNHNDSYEWYKLIWKWSVNLRISVVFRISNDKRPIGSGCYEIIQNESIISSYYYCSFKGMIVSKVVMIRIVFNNVLSNPFCRFQKKKESWATKGIGMSVLSTLNGGIVSSEIYVT